MSHLLGKFSFSVIMPLPSPHFLFYLFTRMFLLHVLKTCSVLRLWHGDEIEQMREDFTRWNPSHFDALRKAHGNVDILICKCV